MSALTPGLELIQKKLNRHMKENLILKTLRIRPFLFLIASEFFSQFSMNLFNFALLIVVFSVANSNTAVSGVVIAFTLPALIFGILAGVMLLNFAGLYIMSMITSQTVPSIANSTIVLID